MKIYIYIVKCYFIVFFTQNSNINTKVLDA